jgi:hypothetical protein
MVMFAVDSMSCSTSKKWGAILTPLPSSVYLIASGGGFIAAYGLECAGLITH